MGDEARFEAMYEANISAVAAYCSRRLGADDADDAAAEVFVVAWRRLTDAPSGSHELPWLYGVARNVVANRRRSNRRLIGLRAKLRNNDDNSSAGPEVQVIAKEEHRELMTALDKLSPKNREILQLVEWEGVDRAVVAVMFGVTPNAINQRMSRAYRRLGRLLGSKRQEATSRPIGERGEARTRRRT